MSSGIDLSASESNNISKINKPVQTVIDETISLNLQSTPPLNDLTTTQKKSLSTKKRIDNNDNNSEITNITSGLTKIAIHHLDKYQWQLPLMEMDKKFRDKTYYKHYSDTYITSLRSKLGHFLADKELISNPMRYHIQQELDNYKKYSKMFDLLTEYYQSLGSGFFSFATPSPDEEIVIGCRLGTKGHYRHSI